MAQEIERKFLVKGDFLPSVERKVEIKQGYLCADDRRTVRLRVTGDACFLTIKSATNERGWSRYEFEQQIPKEDALEMMDLCMPGVIDKVRHYIHVGEHLWEVDLFKGENEGLVVAEIELSSEEESFELPEWVGEEVSGDIKYYNSMLSKCPYSRWQKK